MPSKRRVPRMVFDLRKPAEEWRQELSDAGEDLVRLAAAKDAEIAEIKANFRLIMIASKEANDSYIAALATERDGYKLDYEDTRDCLNNERAKFMELFKRLTEQRDRAMKDAAIAWSVCASLHREFGKGRDPLYETRQADFLKHEGDASITLERETRAKK